MARRRLTLKTELQCLGNQHGYAELVERLMEILEYQLGKVTESERPFVSDAVDHLDRAIDPLLEVEQWHE